MSDTTTNPTTTTPTPVNVQTALTAARQVGGREWHQTASRLIDAGAKLSGADQRLYQAMQRSMAASVAVSGETEPAPAPADARTVEQKATDELFGIKAYEPAEFGHYSLPDTVLANDPGLSEIQRDLARFAADAHFPPALGKAFIVETLRSAGEMAQLSPAQRTERIALWQAQARQALGAKYDEALANADAVIAMAKDNPLAGKLKSLGVIFNPQLLMRLSTRGAILQAWRAERP
jgi:hypothetical protein